MPPLPPNTPAIFAAIAIAVFALLLVLEHAFPLRERKSRTLRRIALNLAITGLGVAAGSLVVKPVATRLTHWAATRPFGLLYVVDMPGPARLALGFLLMDLAFYYWHWANHRVRLMWRFHNCHHIDPDLDVSTSFRFHVGETAYSVAFRAAQIALIGVPPALYAGYELALLCAVMFHHSNVRLPIGFERLLNKVLVTPRMHGVHHSVCRPETDSNYASIFSWWDRLHKTLRINIPQRDVTIGIAGYSSEEDNRFWTVMKMPFEKQREYDRWPSGALAARERVAGEDAPNKMLA